MIQRSLLVVMKRDPEISVMGNIVPIAVYRGIILTATGRQAALYRVTTGRLPILLLAIPDIVEIIARQIIAVLMAG